MKSRILSCVTAMMLFAALANPVRLGAQDKQDDIPRHHHYKLIDMGTFGGPASFVVGEGGADGAPGLNEHGVAVGGSAISTPTSPSSNPLVCGGNTGAVPFVFRALRWKNGTTTNLGALPGDNNCSSAFAVDAKGEIVGASENGAFDPQTGKNQTRAVVWRDGAVMELGSFGGNQNGALGINNRGQIIGNSLNTIPDPYSILDLLLGSTIGTQTRAFLWQRGQMQDLGTLGGNDAVVGPINDRGQIVGASYTNTTPNPATGIPTQDPFLWENGRMIDLGTLGGTFGSASGLNNHGQVIGYSALAGDQTTDPFLWDHGKLIDLYTSTTGGNPLTVSAINDTEEIIGAAAFPNGLLDAYIWRNGVATDLGNLGDCGSAAIAINSHSQIVGLTVSCDGAPIRAFLWENGSIVDLNTLIPAGSSLHLVWAPVINDRGEIAGAGVPPGVPPANFDAQGHAFVLIPCDEETEAEGCKRDDDADRDAVSNSAASSAPARATATQPTLSPSEMKDRIRVLLSNRKFRFLSQRP